MSKASGGTRLLTPYIGSMSQNIAAYNMLMSKTTVYDAANSYISPTTGAYVAFMKGHNMKDPEDEMFVAKSLANVGINVTLTPEGGGFEMFATNKAKNKYSEGYASIYTFEQKTPEVNANSTLANSVKKGIDHANTKHSQVAVIYDKFSVFHRQDIEDGMKLYTSKTRNWQNKAKFVVVVNSKGEVYEHHFD